MWTSWGKLVNRPSAGNRLSDTIVGLKLSNRPRHKEERVCDGISAPIGASTRQLAGGQNRGDWDPVDSREFVETFSETWRIRS